MTQITYDPDGDAAYVTISPGAVPLAWAASTPAQIVPPGGAVNALPAPAAGITSVNTPNPNPRPSSAPR